jgi:hypothetical protein
MLSGTFEDGRLVVGLADHDLHLQDCLAVLMCLEMERWDIHDDVARAEVVGHPSPSLEVERNLIAVLRHRRFGQGLLQCRILRVLWLDRVGPGCDTALDCSDERADEIGRVAASLPSGIDALGLRSSDSDVAAERQQSGGDPNVCLSQLACALLSAFLRGVLAGG